MSTQSQTWSAIDQTETPSHCVSYLHTVSALENVNEYKRMTYALLEARPGSTILDVGCGAGDDVRALGEIVGPTGRVIGIDNSAAMVAAASARAEASELPIEFHVGTITQLDFADNTFDGCRSDRVFQHLEDRRQGLAEMVRVVRPGGRVVVSDTDWETLVLDVPNKALTRKLRDAICDRVRNGWSGRQLFRLFKLSGLHDVRVIPSTIVETNLALADQLFGIRIALQSMEASGALTAAEMAEYLTYMESASRMEAFFCAVTGFGVSGQKR
jgi:ubiquinone/menaquinone biosynthesis C-methylase UbiE